MSKLKQAAGKYAASIRSEEYAVGRSETEKFVDGMVAGLAFEAGVRWARGELMKMVEEQRVNMKSDTCFFSEGALKELHKAVEEGLE